MTDLTRPQRLLLVNGPNLNLLGTREPQIYGTATLADVEELTRTTASELGYEVTAIQSNHEGVLLDAIHEARQTCAGIVINAGALTHTSVALRDALVAAHISNVHKREEFRHHSYISGVAELVIVGAGIRGYVYAVQHLISLLTSTDSAR
jgi:3-dehydroquinate dehydratase-2